ncbi:hypothetical protein FOA52_006849 [Chlamydomonas sp. UWO 241]|nr:hypothetical protein FOA52_006849 [Chlamydomonas sp. UWO 241]
MLVLLLAAAQAGDAAPSRRSLHSADKTLQVPRRGLKQVQSSAFPYSAKCQPESNVPGASPYALRLVSADFMAESSKFCLQVEASGVTPPTDSTPFNCFSALMMNLHEIDLGINSSCAKHITSVTFNGIAQQEWTVGGQGRVLTSDVIDLPFQSALGSVLCIESSFPCHSLPRLFDSRIAVLRYSFTESTNGFCCPDDRGSVALNTLSPPPPAAATPPLYPSTYPPPYGTTPPSYPPMYPPPYGTTPPSYPPMYPPPYGTTPPSYPPMYPPPYGTTPPPATPTPLPSPTVFPPSPPPLVFDPSLQRFFTVTFTGAFSNIASPYQMITFVDAFFEATSNALAVPVAQLSLSTRSPYDNVGTVICETIVSCDSPAQAGLVSLLAGLVSAAPQAAYNDTFLASFGFDNVGMYVTKPPAQTPPPPPTDPMLTYPPAPPTPSAYPPLYPSADPSPSMYPPMYPPVEPALIWFRDGVTGERRSA